MAKIIKIDFVNPDLAIKKAFDILQNGGVVSFPTETFYGLGVNALDENAVSKVFRIKKRNASNPLLVFISAKEQLSDLTPNVNSTAKKLIDRFWPGPLTLVFEASSKLPKTLTANTGKIGIRISGFSFVRELCKLSDFPITGSSANISNEPEPVSAEDVLKAMGDKIDLLLDGGKTAGAKSSTVIDVSSQHPILIRSGMISEDLIKEALKS